MNKYIKKMIAPVIIALFTCGFLISYVAVLSFPEGPTIIKGIVELIPITLAIVSICVLIERIKEIRKGEEDDFGKY